MKMNARGVLPLEEEIASVQLQEKHQETGEKQLNTLQILKDDNMDLEVDSLDAHLTKNPER